MSAHRAYLFGVVLIAFAALVLPGCKKKKSKKSAKKTAEETADQAESGPAMTRLLHLSPDLGPTRFVVDSRPPSRTDELKWFSGKAPKLSVPSGWQRLSLEYIPEEDSAEEREVQYVRNLKVRPGEDYWTLLVGMKKPNRGDRRLDIRMVPTRGLPKEPNDKLATVRVLNAATNMSPLDATLRQVNDGVKSSEDMELFVNIGFAKATTYRQVDPTNAKIEFRSGLDKGGKPLYVSEKFELVGGARYTLLLFGRQGSSDHPLQIKLLDESMMDPDPPEPAPEEVAKKK